MAEVLGLTIKVAIITGQYLVWIGLQTILESSNRGFQVVGNPSQCITSPELLTECRPDVIIIDMETERDAMKSIAQLRESSPDSKVLLLSGFEGKDPVREALECGVDGVILKIHPPLSYARSDRGVMLTIPSACSYWRHRHTVHGSPEAFSIKVWSHKRGTHLARSSDRP